MNSKWRHGNRKSRAGEMAQSVKRLLLKHENWVQSQNPCKNYQLWWHTSVILELGRRRQADWPRLTGQSAWPNCEALVPVRDCLKTQARRGGGFPDGFRDDLTHLSHKPDNVSTTPQIHSGETTNSWVLFSDLLMRAVACMYPHTCIKHTATKIKHNLRKNNKVDRTWVTNTTRGWPLTFLPMHPHTCTHPTHA